MPAPSSTQLDPDLVDDLLYLARAGETEELRSTLVEASSSLSLTQTEIIAAARSDSETGLLHMAAANGHTETLKTLLETLSAESVLKISSETSADSSSVQNTTQPVPSAPETASQSHQSLPHPLINQPNNAGNTPLHWAALNGRLECARLLLHAGADVDCKNAAGRDAVFEAEEAGHGELAGELLGTVGGNTETSAEAELDDKEKGEEGGAAEEMQVDAKETNGH